MEASAVHIGRLLVQADLAYGIVVHIGRPDATASSSYAIWNMSVVALGWFLRILHCISGSHRPSRLELVFSHSVSRLNKGFVGSERIVHYCLLFLEFHLSRHQRNRGKCAAHGPLRHNPR